MIKIKIQIKFQKERLLKIILIQLQILMAKQSNKRILQFFRKFSLRLNLSISKSVIIHRLKNKKKKIKNRKNLRRLKK
jgi:hypothetical protein